MNMDLALSNNEDRLELLTEAITDILVLPRLVGRYVVQVQTGRSPGKFADDEIPASGYDRAIQWLLGTTNVLRSRFFEFRREMGRRAFTVARVFEETVLDRIKRSLAKSIASGEPLDEWQDRLKVPDSSGVSILDEVGVGALQPYHAETVFRATWQNSFQVAIKDGYDRTRGTWAYYEYVTIDDDRVRPAHAAMHGVRRPVTDPIWKTWWPPNGYNCRCTVIAISKVEASEDRIKPTDAPRDVDPDEGWEGEPG